MTKKHTNLYEYLHQTGVLESKDDELIKKVKAAYWRKYHRDYKQEKRKKDREYSIALNKEERAYFEKEAERHGKSVSMFLKDAAMAYIHCEFLNPDKSDVQKIQQLLSRCYSDIEPLGENQTCISRVQKTLEAIERTEEMIQHLFSKPPSLEDTLRQKLTDKPYYLETIKSIIESHDNQVQGETIKNGN
jgi:hypothetical protein